MELADDPSTYEFSVQVNAAGDWRIDVDAKWGDGRSFSKEWVEFLDVPWRNPPDMITTGQDELAREFSLWEIR